jgi:Amt family ammonium transporter
VAGLVAITPASGFVTPLSAVAIGFGAGIVCYVGVSLKARLGYDDSLDAVGVHGVGGTFGALATALFATTAVNAAGTNGVLYGSWSLLFPQVLSVLAASAYAFGVTWVLLKVLDKTVGLRIGQEEEVEGLDLSQHGESGYIF